MSNCVNSDNYNLRIKAKCHGHLHTLIKIPAKFQNDPDEIVGGVAFTRLDVICDEQSDGQTDTQGKQYVSGP